ACAARLAVGDVCDPNVQTSCPEGSGCAQEFASDGGPFYNCYGSQPLGGRCGPYVGVGCDSQTVCSDPYDGTCVALRGPGETCDPIFGYPSCAPPQLCPLNDAGPSTCQLPPGLGAPCNTYYV